MARRPIHDGRLLRFYDDQVSLADGTLTHREVVEHSGSVAIVPFDGDGNVVLVRQWRHPVGEALWEVPAGTRDRDEPAAATAERELEEETGLRAASWRKLGAWALVPGYSTEVMHFFLATDLAPGTAHTDHDERVVVGRFDPAAVRELIRTEAVDVKTIAGIAMAGWMLSGDD